MLKSDNIWFLFIYLKTLEYTWYKIIQYDIETNIKYVYVLHGVHRALKRH